MLFLFCIFVRKNQLEKDVKKNDYNTFKAKYEDKNAQEIKDTIREGLYTSMTFTLENAASAYNLLEIYKNKDIKIDFEGIDICPEE